MPEAGGSTGAAEAAGPTGAADRWVHRIRVRYGEVDMQRVVFNAHYLAYCDGTSPTGSY